MTMTQNKSENDMTPLNRVTIKASGLTVWEIESASGITYYTTWAHDHVSGCQQKNGEPCKSFQYRGRCHHASLVEQRESERQSVVRKAEEVSTFAACRECNDVFGKEALVNGLCDFCQPVRGNLNGTREFSLLK